MWLNDTDECRIFGEEEETPIHLTIKNQKREEYFDLEAGKCEELAFLKPSQIFFGTLIRYSNSEALNGCSKTIKLYFSFSLTISNFN